MKSEFAQNSLRIHSEFTWTRILPFLPFRSEFGRNESEPKMKFGWILTENPFLPNSYHSYQIPTIPTKFQPIQPNSAQNLVGIVGMHGGVSSTCTREGREGSGNKNGPKRCQTRHLGHRYVFFLKSCVFYIITNDLYYI